VPVWHERTRQWVEDGKLVLLGITQEQHADRCRLFAQWKEFDWPILHDPINRRGSQAVPSFFAIDEHGIVRSTRPRLNTFEEDFLNVEFEDDASEPADTAPDPPSRRDPPEPGETDPEAWIAFGDWAMLWGSESDRNRAVDAYQKAVELNPEDGPAWFRLGVALRARHESPDRRPDDFQDAVTAWGKALDINPNQYIWRRRIQQYGPRLIKPYPFYDWVDQAIAAIKERGEEPVTLAVRPYGAEIAQPSRSFQTDVADGERVEPDAEGRIHRDEDGLIDVETAVVPDRIAPGESARVHLTFRPDDEHRTYWNNEVEPMKLWVDPPKGWEISSRLHQAPLGSEIETRETRRLDFEVHAPEDASGPVTFDAYALYYVCEDVGGVCLYLRQDIPITVDVQSSNR